MIRSVPRMPSRARVRLRRREVRRCLAHAGLAPLRRWSKRHEAAVDLSHEARLERALVRLGPVFSTFGLYLATRIDLLPDGYGACLAALIPRAQPTPWEVVHPLLIQELGRQPSVAYAAFEEEPFEVGLLFQAHHARLDDGEPVVVKVAHPDRDEEVATDLAALSLLRDVFADGRESAQTLDNALHDFGNAIRHQTDFVRQAKIWEAIAQDEEIKECLYVPRVYRGLSSGQVLTVGETPGPSVADCSLLAKETSIDGRPGNNLPGGRELAVKLCEVWLRLSLQGSFFPVDVRPRDISILPDGRVAFPGSFAGMPPPARKILWEYLLATSTGDPDSACNYLVRLLGRGSAEAGAEELRHCFRQAVPASGDLRGMPESDLGALMLAHWRAVLELGFRPPVYLTRFFRALFQVRATAARLAPCHDALRAALDEIRVAAVFTQFRELMGLASLVSRSQRYAPLLLELPRWVDEGMALLAEGGTRLKVRVQKTAQRRAAKSMSMAVTALFLALAALGLLGNGLSVIGLPDGWSDKVLQVAVLVIGVLVLGRLAETR